MTFATIVFSIVSVIFCAWIGEKLGRDMAFYFVSDSNTFLAVTNGICSFLFFKNLKIRQSRLINVIAASTFGVLCIHANSDTMRKWLWRDVLNNVAVYNSGYLVLHAIISVVSVFSVCIAIDQVRIWLIEKPIFKFFRDFQKRGQDMIES